MNYYLRLGWSKEIKPVLFKCKNYELLTDVDHVSRQTCLGLERDFGGYELCGTRALIGRLSLCYVEGLMPDLECDTPYVQVTIVALQRSSKAAEYV